MKRGTTLNFRNRPSSLVVPCDCMAATASSSRLISKSKKRSRSPSSSSLSCFVCAHTSGVRFLNFYCSQKNPRSPIVFSCVSSVLPLGAHRLIEVLHGDIKHKRQVANAQRDLCRASNCLLQAPKPHLCSPIALLAIRVVRSAPSFQMRVRGLRAGYCRAMDVDVSSGRSRAKWSALVAQSVNALLCAQRSSTSFFASLEKTSDDGFHRHYILKARLDPFSKNA
jgi:hypothetical protein